jgi:hypothetical protein
MTTNRPLYTIAREIRANWSTVHYTAKPYLEAMATLNNIGDTYIFESARSIVAYFLSNASSWRGDKARAIKTELKNMLKV